LSLHVGPYRKTQAVGKEQFHEETGTIMTKNRIYKTVLATLIAELCVAAYADAQTTSEQAAPAGDGAVQQVVVSGIRASLSSSLTTKRLQDGVVDAVSAEDAGKFPDTNIAESLQRVTGVQIQRNNGEGRYISVRGLGPEFNNVLINGRTMTSDTGGREFSFDVLSSDLISKAIVYKTSQAFLPEGGIGSTVDIQTTRPQPPVIRVMCSTAAGFMPPTVRLRSIPPKTSRPGASFRARKARLAVGS